MDEHGRPRHALHLLKPIHIPFMLLCSVEDSGSAISGCRLAVLLPLRALIQLMSRSFFLAGALPCAGTCGAVRHPWPGRQQAVGQLPHQAGACCQHSSVLGKGSAAYEELSQRCAGIVCGTFCEFDVQRRSFQWQLAPPGHASLKPAPSPAFLTSHAACPREQALEACKDVICVVERGLGSENTLLNYLLDSGWLRNKVRHWAGVHAAQQKPMHVNAIPTLRSRWGGVWPTSGMPLALCMVGRSSDSSPAVDLQPVQ